MLADCHTHTHTHTYTHTHTHIYIYIYIARTRTAHSLNDQAREQAVADAGVAVTDKICL